MAIARTMNPFTCHRDLKELEMLILAHTGVMLWIQLSRESRAKIRELRKLGYADGTTPIENATAKHKDNLRILGNNLDEYRFRCQCARMNINEATAFRDKLVEYIEEL